MTTRWRTLALFAVIAALMVVAFIGWSRQEPSVTVPAPPPPRASTKAPLPVSCPVAPACVPAPDPLPAPTADPALREAKRFDRNDRNDDGVVNSTEYLTSRRKSFEKMDANGDRLINFSEYSVKQRDRFARSDCDQTGTLNPDEFASTATRKDAPKPKC